MKVISGVLMFAVLMAVFAQIAPAAELFEVEEATCGRNGAVCSSDLDCCSRKCHNNEFCVSYLEADQAASEKKYCRKLGYSCSAGSECCSGVCSKEPICTGLINSLDIWAVTPHEGCAKHGEKCSSHKDCCNEYCVDKPICVSQVNNETS